MLRNFLWLMGISAGASVVSVLAHNLISGWFGIEELVFFFIAVVLCPAAFIVGAVDSIIVLVKR